MENKINIIVSTIIDAPIEKIWQYWNEAEHIKRWHAASSDWHAPKVKINLKQNGKFKIRMEAKDLSKGLNFEGIYSLVVEHKIIKYFITDGRKVQIDFINKQNKVQIIQTFEADNLNSYIDQQHGWQAILDNFKEYVVSN